MTSIGVVIPCHPARKKNGMLARAIRSVERQTLQASEIHVAMDEEGEGARSVRNRGIMAIDTEWVALLDSDDELRPHHLEHLHRHATQTGADFVYPWYDVVGGKDPRPFVFGQAFNYSKPNYTTITVLVRTAVAQEAVRRMPPTKALDKGARKSDDYAFLLDCVAQGIKVEHLAERTWIWHHHGQNSSGRPDLGDAQSPSTRKSQRPLSRSQVKYGRKRDRGKT